MKGSAGNVTNSSLFRHHFVTLFGLNVGPAMSLPSVRHDKNGVAE
jgi:hypothetical protein